MSYSFLQQFPGQTFDEHLLCAPCSARPRGGWWALLIRSSRSSAGTVKGEVQGHPRSRGQLDNQEEELQICLCDPENFSEETTLFSRHSRGRKGGSEEKKEGKVCLTN